MSTPSNLFPRKAELVLSVASLALFCGWLPSHTRAQELKEFDTDYLETPDDGPALNQAEKAIVERTNAFRTEHGLETLKTNPRLQKAAAYFAAFMARTNKYGHTADGNRPSERASLFDYNYCIVAENIAYQMKSTGFETEELAKKFFEGWKESPEHRENMLQTHVTETGVAIGHTPDSDRYFAVQLVGRPRSAAVEFRVTNRTGESIRYAVSVAGSGQNEAKRREFNLPPRATMYHTRCRPTEINWGWTEADDATKVSNNRAYKVEKSGGEYSVAENEIDGSASPQ